MDRTEQDKTLLSMYEDFSRSLESELKKIQKSQGNFHPAISKRFQTIRNYFEFERRLLEEVSLPARLIIEHFSQFINDVDDIIGFSSGNITSGQGRLHQIKIEEWGTIVLTIGDSEITWRDSDVSYLFYPDKITVRAKDSLKDSDINFTFNFSFNHANGILLMFQDVSRDKKTLYWHEKLTLD